MPADRWDLERLYDPDPDAAGKIATRWGGFLPRVDQFDPGFFGISPREALSMDPQQRLMLEVAWEALENAGQAPDRLPAAPTGVFVGICNADYYQVLAKGGLESFDAYLASGNANSVVSGRISYVLGLQGPAHLRRHRLLVARSWPSTSPARACGPASAAWRSPAA